MTARSFRRPQGPLVPIPPELTTAEARDERRFVRLEGAFNFRDLGGYTTADGRELQWGLVFRSEHLNDLTDADRAVIGGLGLHSVIDFRLPFEREQRPSRLAHGPQFFHYGMSDLPDAEEGVRRIQAALAGEGPVPGWTHWFETYHDMIDRSGPMFVRTFETLATPGRLPALFHCTGGKDRTGLAAVLLLDMLGVGADAIADDFALTNLYRTPRRARDFGPMFEANGVALEEALPILGVVPAAMADAYRRIVEQYGGAEGYLVSNGLDASVPERLRSFLLTAP